MLASKIELEAFFISDKNETKNADHNNIYHRIYNYLWEILAEECLHRFMLFVLLLLLSLLLLYCKRASCRVVHARRIFSILKLKLCTIFTLPIALVKPYNLHRMSMDNLVAI